LKIINQLKVNARAVFNSSLSKEFMLFSISTLVLQVLRMGNSFVGAKLLGPEIWGYWYILNLILIYGPNIQLGALNAMNRDVPICRGENNWAKVYEIQDNSLGFQILSGLILSICVLLYALLINENGKSLPLLCMSFLIFAHNLYMWFQMYLKSIAHFNVFSIQQIIFGILLIFITIPLTFFKGLNGFIIGQFITTILTISIIINIEKIKINPKINFPIILKLIKVGWPILGVGLVFTLLKTVDRWMIAGFLGKTQLGYYSLALMVSNVLFLLPMVVAQQIYPRMAETWGKTKSLSDVMRWAKIQTMLSVSLSTFSALIVGFLVKILVPLILPEYLPGLPAVYPMLLVPVFFSFITGTGNMLNTIGRQKVYLLMQLCLLPVMVILDFLAIKLGFGIAGVAYATMTTFALYSLIFLAITKLIIKHN
jgi:O-antigen/teichoic acid export membrane protein